MRVILIAVWLLLPIGFAFWHYGPGQDRVRLDQVAELLSKAQQQADEKAWAEAARLYEEALQGLPEGKATQRRRIQLELAKARMNSGQLPTAHTDLKHLVDEIQDDGSEDAKFKAEARTALAQSQFYMTWLMRLEGQPREIWEPEIESARQTYRLLAEESDRGGDAKTAQKQRENLEAAVRLARLELADLQGLPLPSQ